MQQAPTAVAGVRKLHRGLLVGQIMMIGLFAGLPLLTGGPVLRGRLADAALLPAGFGVALIAVGMLVMRRRVPDRPGSQSPEAYWTEPANRRAATLFWVLIDGGTFMSAVAYGLSGDFVPAMMAAAGLGLLAIHGPSRLANA